MKRLYSAVTSTKWPAWNMDGKFELSKSGRNWESTVDAGLTDSDKRINYVGNFINNSNRNKVDFDLTCRFNCKVRRSIVGINQWLVNKCSV